MKVRDPREQPVLVCVDDDEQLLETIEYLLGKHFPSYSVVACPGGQDALEQLDELRRRGREVHLVLSDQVMPEVTGIQLLSQVPRIYPDAVRIILTGQAGLHSAIDAIKEGVDDYLEKPLSEMELVKTLRTHLNNFLLRRENRRLQQFLRQSRRRTSEITDLAFRAFNDHLTRLLSGQGDRAQILSAVRRSRENIALLSYLYRIDEAIEGGNAFAPIDPGELVADILGQMKDADGRPVTEARRLQVDLVSYEDGEGLISNRAAVRIALERILENACRFAPDGSALTISVRGPRFDRAHERPDPRLPPEITDLLRRQHFVITLRNEGIPTAADVEQLQLAQAGSTQGGTERLTGLGLVIASEYLLLLGGQLRFDAQAGRPGVEAHLAIPQRQTPG